jgi:hypothetical protein
MGVGGEQIVVLYLEILWLDSLVTVEKKKGI